MLRYLNRRGDENAHLASFKKKPPLVAHVIAATRRFLHLHLPLPPYNNDIPLPSSHIVQAPGGIPQTSIRKAPLFEQVQYSFIHQLSLEGKSSASVITGSISRNCILLSRSCGLNQHTDTFSHAL